MKTLRRLFNGQGFTLVELMVVVAIIGILSAVAIPNFKKYQAKSKTSEAKLHLASIYSAETSFQADTDNFASCLSDMGYNPATEAANRYYLTGFNDIDALASGGSRSATNFGAASNTINGVTCSNAATVDGTNYFLPGKKVKGVSAVLTDLSNSVVPPASGASFTAGAVGQISPDVGVDKWSINQAKNVVHTTTGY